MTFPVRFRLNAVIVWLFPVSYTHLDVYKRQELDLLLTIYGLLILAVAARGLLGHGDLRIPPWLVPILLIAAGIIHGLFLSGGALLVIYAKQRLDVYKRQH